MVGVPGKSKGCSTCRRRKKGCDQKRPTCGQCAASGYTCGGYQRDLTFVLHPASKAVEKAVFVPTKLRPSLLTSTHSLERSAIVVQCHSLFFDVYLPHGRCEVNDQFILRCGHPANWTHVMQTFTPTETSLELAFAAFSISRVGRNTDDPRLVKESTKFYGKALKTLQKALYDPLRMHSEQVLAACLLLGQYETFEGAGGKSVGWVSHAQGAARIVELRGPERHAEPPAHTLFQGTRLPIIYSAILRRKRTFLSDEDWLSIPWSRVSKTGLDRLIDIATHVPGLLEQFDVARSQSPSTEQLKALQSCLSYCRNLQRSLSTWNTIRRPNSVAIVINHEKTTQSDDYPFDEELTYENHLFLNANLIYWSSALVISNTISEIEFLLASFGFQSTSMLSSTASAVQEAQKCATNIAKSIPYCLWSDMGDIGIEYVQFPMCLAFEFFMKSSNPRVCSWILLKANEMQKMSTISNSPRENSPMSYSGSGGGIATFGAAGLSNQTNLASTLTATTLAPDPVSVSVTRVSQTPFNTRDSQHSAGEISSSANKADVVGSAYAANGSDFDVDYDLDSDPDLEAPASDSYNSSTPTVCSSRHDSAHSTAGHTHRSLIKPLLDLSDFTFIQENPSRYYIDRTEIIVGRS